MHYLQFTSDNAEPRLIGTRIIGIVLYVYFFLFGISFQFFRIFYYAVPQITLKSLVLVFFQVFGVDMLCTLTIAVFSSIGGCMKRAPIVCTVAWMSVKNARGNKETEHTAVPQWNAGFH
jgi:hypothetical protein